MDAQEHHGAGEPWLAVESFVRLVQKGDGPSLSKAYWFLTAPEKTAVPLEDWVGGEWDAARDEALADAEIKVMAPLVTSATPQREATIPVRFTSPKSESVEVPFVSRLEGDGWHVYLGLDRVEGRWQPG